MVTRGIAMTASADYGFSFKVRKGPIVLLLGLALSFAAVDGAAAQIADQTPEPQAEDALADEPVIDPATGEPIPEEPAGPALVDGFTVTGVDVAATGATTAQARETAFAQGQRIALSRLADSLGGQLDMTDLAERDIARLIQGFQVEEETVTSGNYAAKLTFSFRPSEVRALVREQQQLAAPPQQAGPVATAGSPTGAVLVVPVFRSDLGDRLWDSPNPWHEAWLNRANAADSVPLIVPFGDLLDVGELSTAQALNGDLAGLTAITNRYGAQEPLVALLTENAGGYSLNLTWYPSGGLPVQEAVPFSSLGGATSFQQIVEEAALRIQRGPLPSSTPAAVSTSPVLASQPPRIGGGASESVYLVPIRSIEDWVEIRNRLERIPAIIETVVVSLAPGEAIVGVEILGSEGVLRDQLAQQRLGIEMGTGGLEIRRLDVF